MAAMEEIAEAAAKLYASLKPEQQALADKLLAGTIPALYSGLGSTASRAGRAPPSSAAAR